MDPLSQDIFDQMLDELRNMPWYTKLWWWICRQAFNIKLLPKRIYRFVVGKIQRSRRGFSHEDTWNLDQYLAKVIASSVTHLRHTTHGYPSTMTESEWDNILRKIVLGFNLYVYSRDMETLTEDEKAKMDEGMQLFIQHFRHLWD